MNHNARKSKRTSFLYLLQAVFLTAFACISLAQPNALAQGAASKSKSTSPKYKAVITNSKDKKWQSSKSKEPVQGEIFLRADIIASAGGLKAEIEPYYTDKSGLTAEQYGKLVTSPLVQGRVALWKGWYSRVFDETVKDIKVPAALREKINVTVTKSHKVTATVEWMDPSEDPAVKEVADKVLNRIRAFETASWIAFPEKSYLELVTFDIYLQDDRIQLGNGVQKVDYD